MTAALQERGTRFFTLDLPPELQAFVERGTRPIDIASADLDGNGTKDFVLVLEDSPECLEETDQATRILLVISRQRDGRLILARRGTHAVGDTWCGGGMGDCFQGVTAAKQQFEISDYGGSGLRWNTTATFRYSRRDKTWQLIKVEQSCFPVSRPSEDHVRIYRPPRDFTKIDIEGFRDGEFLWEFLKQVRERPN
jgi:hypothetical protein